MSGGHERPAAAQDKLPLVVAALVLLSCLEAPRQIFAQRLERVAVVWDNDILALRGTGAPPDYDYTQLGEQVQNGIHRLVGATPQQGWDHQLHTEPAALLRYTAAWPRTFAGLQLRPYIAVGAGTLWTGAAGGLAIGAGARPGNRGPHAGADVRQEWVLRNLFLDGNTFRASARTDKRTWVSEAAFAVGYRFHAWDIAYRFVIRSAEYRAQPRPHAYGSLVLVWHR